MAKGNCWGPALEVEALYKYMHQTKGPSLWEEHPWEADMGSEAAQDGQQGQGKRARLPAWQCAC